MSEVLQPQVVDMPRMKALAEAALFMSSNPLTLDQLGKLIKSEGISMTVQVVDEMIRDFNGRNAALEIVRTMDGRYRMQVRKDLLGSVKDLAINVDFSKSVLRTLAIIAFKQPIRQSIIIKMRGNKAYDHIVALEEQGFVKKTKEGNTFLLDTTKKFIDYFGEPVRAAVLPGDSRATLDRQIEAASKAVEEEDPAQTTLEEQLERLEKAQEDRAESEE
jgi:segregation and condensation protein B